MNSSRTNLAAVASSCALVVAALCSSASAGIVEVGANYFGVGTTVVTFDEVAEGTTLPFSIGLADFSGSGGLVYSYLPGDPGAPPSPSDSPFLYTGSSGMDDWIEVLLGAPQEAVGAYFNAAGGGAENAILQFEVYSGETLLGVLATTPDANFGGFIGASAGGAIIDRVIFRDIDDSLPVSFRIDDFQFIPAPGVAPLMMVALLPCRRRRS